MKTNCWLILGTMIVTGAVAQVNTNTLPEIPPPAMSLPAPAAPAVAPVETKPAAPVKKTAKTRKKTVKKTKAAAKPVAKKVAEAAVTLVAGPAMVAADNVNLRGQAGLKGEVVGQVKKGDTVTVIAEINLDKPKAGEPAQWAKIVMPSGSKVWIDSRFVDTANKMVAVKKLNLRGGPGENYSVLGLLEKGAAVTEVTSKGDWMQIEAPDNAFAFVAAGYLKQEVPVIETNVPVVAAVEPVVPTPTTVAEPQPVTPETVAVPPSQPAPEVDTNLPPPPPRVVTHEGDVRPSVSLVAPTTYELYDPASNLAINYLYSPTTNLDVGRYNGFHIDVTGEEGLDSRWQDTPVLTIQKIYVLSGPAPRNMHPSLKK